MTRTAMQCVAITGAGGFVGSRLVRALALRPETEVRALIRRGRPPQPEDEHRLAIVRGDVADSAVLDQLLRPGCVVANFAYDASAPADLNPAAAHALADACVKYGVRRMVHCSTAVVAGRTDATRIDETTACRPWTGYEKTKLAIESLLRDKARGKFELVILRPTAVFGAGGRNLLKLARDLTKSSRLTNYLRSCAYGRRRMHLVDVDNVAAAAAFLLATRSPVDQEIFIISDDEAPENNFHDVEQYLMRAFAIPEYAVPPVAVPAAALSLLLRLRGRSMLDPATVFVGDKLKDLGFIKPVNFMAGLATFARWYNNNTLATKAGPG